MQIAPISIKSSKTYNINFKGQNKQEPTDPTKSKQHNSKEIFIDPKAYMAMSAISFSKNQDLNSRFFSPKMADILNLLMLSTGVPSIKEAMDSPMIFNTDTDLEDDIDPEFSEIIEHCLTYQIHRAINAGFEGDARKVINILSNDCMMYNKPKTDNDDNLIMVQTYPDGKNSYIKVKRYKSNGDYMSMQLFREGECTTRATFKKDGSIGYLLYTNPIDNSIILIDTNTKTNTVTSTQTYKKDQNSVINIKKTFLRHDDGALELIKEETSEEEFPSS